MHTISKAHSLMVNSLTGAVDLLDEEVGSALESSGGAGSLDPALHRKLLDRGHLFESKADEDALVEKTFKAYMPKRRMIRFTISPTYSCNLRCTYCFEKNRVAGRSPVMGEEEVDLIFAAVESISSGEPDLPKAIALFGGEPLLPRNRRVVRRALMLSSERKLPVSVATNGVHLPLFKEELRAFASPLQVQVTLDGPREIHDRRRVAANGSGTYDEVVSAVNLLLDLGKSVNLRVNVDSQNLPYLRELVDLIRRFGWPDYERFKCSLAPVTDHTGSGDNPHLLEEWELLGPIFDLFEEDRQVSEILQTGMFRSLNHLRAVVEGGRSSVPQLFYCEANNRESFEFGPDGLIYACSEAMDNPDHAIGRYRPELELFEEKASLWDNRNVATIEKCRSCELAFFCGGGCAYSALARNGSLYEPHCGSIRKLIDVYLERVGERLVSKAMELDPELVK
ncbi:MAG: radical SAM protein [Actinobacteria bacterium]|nr:radical SAM protein [Actinomycetota bacterium]